MYNGISFLGIILARAGSIRLPNKNMLLLAGKPMIQYTIDAARESKYLDHYQIISNIPNLIDKHLIHPAYLSSASAKTEDVMLYVIFVLEYLNHIYVLDNFNHTYDAIVLLQPTSPERTGETIDKAIEAWKGKLSLISVNKNGFRNGCIYIANKEDFVTKHGFGEVYQILVQEHDFIDVDTQEDFDLVEKRMK